MTTPATVEKNNAGFFLSLPIRKIDIEKREVWGFATKEELDQQGEIVEYEASKAAFSTFADQFQKSTGGLSMGALREMHQPKAVGSLIAFKADDKEKGIWIGAKLSRSADGENALTKVKERVLTGFSIGAPIAEREMTFDAKLGKRVNRVVSYKLSEVSLVDNPACPSAVIEQVKLAKVVGGDSAVPSGLLEPIIPDWEVSPAAADAPVEKALEPNAYVDGFGNVWKRHEKLAAAVAPATISKENAMTLKGTNIGPQHREGSSPGTTTPEVPPVVAGEEAVIPTAGGGMKMVDEQGKPVTVPDGQGKTSGFPPAPAAPGAPPAPAVPAAPVAAHPMAPAGQPPKYCGYCGQGLAPQAAAPVAGAPPAMPPQPGAPKSAAFGVAEPTGMEKAMSENAQTLKLVIQGVSDLAKRVETLAASPIPGGPMRTELPSGVAPVEKGVVGGQGPGAQKAYIVALKTAIAEEKDPFVADTLRKRLVTAEIRAGYGG